MSRAARKTKRNKPEFHRVGSIVLLARFMSKSCDIIGEAELF
jgi:hypothetical protein